MAEAEVEAEMEMETEMDEGEGEERIRQSLDSDKETRRIIRQLHEKVKENDIEGVRELLESTPSLDIDAIIEDKSPLQICVMKGYNEIAEMLCAREADVNRHNDEYYHLLHMCCWNYRTRMFEILLKAGAYIEAKNHTGATPLSFAVYRGCTDIVRMCVDSGCNVNNVNNYGETPLMLAARYCKMPVIPMLIEGGSHLEQMDYQHKTALLHGGEAGNSRACLLLIQAGAKINTKDRYGQTPLYLAAQQGYEHVVRAFIQSGADINMRSNNGTTPFYEAVRNKHMITIRLLAYAKADVNLEEWEHGQAPLHLAVRLACQYFEPKDEHADLVRLILSKGANPSVSDRHGWTPLYQSTFAGDVDITRLLLEHGADVHFKTVNGESAFHAGVFGNAPEILQMLVEKGAAINLLNRKHEIPLLTALSLRSDIDVPRILIENGSELNTQDEQKRTPLFAAVQQGYLEPIKLVVKAGCKLNIPNQHGDTPLCMACSKDKDAITKYLLEQDGINVNAGMKNFPLMAAAGRGATHILLPLLEKGANPNKVSIEGKTALYAASEGSHTEAVLLLVEWGANPSIHQRAPSTALCCALYIDPHPHLEVEPIYVATKNDNIALLHHLLMATPRMPYSHLRTLKDILFRTGYAKEARLKTKLVEEFSEFFSEVLSQPRSLQEECRGVIRECLGSQPKMKVKELPLPNKLQDYILLQEELAAARGAEDDS